MITPFMRVIRARTEDALASGDLRPIESEQTTLEDGGMTFTVRWIAALTEKDAAGPALSTSPGGAPSAQAEAGDGDMKRNLAAARDGHQPEMARMALPAAPRSVETTLPGGPRNPDFNPFLHPDPALTIGALGDHHTAILNKFPVCLYHLVLARKVFAEQLSPLEHADFLALAMVLSPEGGLGFYNGGADAGASQRHKHVQWIPDASDNASLRGFVRGLPRAASPGTVARHAALPLEHCFVRVVQGRGEPVAVSADSMLEGFTKACGALGLRPDADDGLLPAFNMLVGDGWMLMVPRCREHFGAISLNALSFGGSLYVREPAQVDQIRHAGPLRVLASVGYPAKGKISPIA